MGRAGPRHAGGPVPNVHGVRVQEGTGARPTAGERPPRPRPALAHADVAWSWPSSQPSAIGPGPWRRSREKQYPPLGVIRRLCGRLLPPVCPAAAGPAGDLGSLEQLGLGTGRPGASSQQGWARGTRSGGWGLPSASAPGEVPSSARSWTRGMCALPPQPPPAGRFLHGPEGHVEGKRSKGSKPRQTAASVIRPAAAGRGASQSRLTWGAEARPAPCFVGGQAVENPWGASGRWCLMGSPPGKDALPLWRPTML